MISRHSSRPLSEVHRKKVSIVIVPCKSKHGKKTGMLMNYYTKACKLNVRSGLQKDMSFQECNMTSGNHYPEQALSTVVLLSL